MSEISRRDFIKFMGRGAAIAGALQALPSCVSTNPTFAKGLPFTPLGSTQADDLVLSQGFRYHIVLRWRDRLNSKGELFGFNNDYLAYLPLDPKNPNEGLMWVNHEFHDPYLNSGWRPGTLHTKEQVDIERKEVGGSIVHIKKSGDQWHLVNDSKFNRRLDAFTTIPFVTERPILGKRAAIGTFANCAGGVTPWGTVLSCEENYHNFIGEARYQEGRRTIQPPPQDLSWLPHADLPPEHYGWVVEVDLKTGSAKKLTALGRFAHECATTALTPDGRCVVYSGHDAEDEHIYKFISSRPGSLEHGVLYAADTINGRWLPLDRKLDPRLHKAFKDQTDLLIRTAEAAKIVGATPHDRPEDIEIDPFTGAVFISLTMSKKRNNPYGSILKIVEKDRNPASLEFNASTFKSGGDEFACPDNMVFDGKGNLWLCTDMSGGSLYKEPYTRFGNNGLFYIPLSGDHAGRAFKVASAPPGAEFTGPCFSPDFKTLFLSVQHPGEGGKDPTRIISHWPDGGQAMPSPCVVAIEGPSLDRLVSS